MEVKAVVEYLLMLEWYRSTHAVRNACVPFRLRVCRPDELLNRALRGRVETRRLVRE